MDSEDLNQAVIEGTSMEDEKISVHIEEDNNSKLCNYVHVSISLSPCQTHKKFFY